MGAVVLHLGWGRKCGAEQTLKEHPAYAATERVSKGWLWYAKLARTGTVLLLCCLGGGGMAGPESFVSTAPYHHSSPRRVCFHGQVRPSPIISPMISYHAHDPFPSVSTSRHSCCSTWRVSTGLHTTAQTVVGAILGTTIGLIVTRSEALVLKHLPASGVPATVKAPVLLAGFLVLYFREMKKALRRKHANK